MELSTRRFLLRDFVDADAAAFEAYHADARSGEFRGAGEGAPGFARELLSRFAAWAAVDPRVNFQLAVVQRDSPHALVGCAGLRCADAEPGTGELGIELAPQYWGRYGYAVEVMAALLEFGFETMALHTIQGETVSANSRMTRLLDSAGATRFSQPTPAWMADRGWSLVGWRIDRPRWESARRARRWLGRLPA